MTTCSTARLEEFVAGDVMGDYLHEAYANGTLNKLADDVIDGKLNQLAAIRTLAVDIMGNSGIVVSESDAKSTGCSLCGSDTTSVLFWILERKQDLAFSQVSYLSDANNVENGPANDKPETGMQAVSARLWGLALAIVALVVWKWQFQSFVARDLAGVSGSLRANWGMLLLLGMPAVLMFIAALQVISGRSITSWVTEKGRQPLASQWATILAALCATAVAALVASLID